MKTGLTTGPAEMLTAPHPPTKTAYVLAKALRPQQAPDHAGCVVEGMGFYTQILCLPGGQHRACMC